MRCLFPFLFFCALTLPVSAVADTTGNDDDIDGILEGEFDEEAEFEFAIDTAVNSTVSTDTDTAPQSPLDTFIGQWSQAAHFTFNHEIGYGLREPEKLVINRSSLRLQWEQLLGQRYFLRFDGKTVYDFVYDGADYSDETREKYRTTSGIREAYLLVNAGSFSIKAGKQVVVWGKADGAVVTDIISPRDLTELVFTPVEDARLGQQMINLEYFRGQSRWSLILNPDAKVNRYADPGHPYGPKPNTRAAEFTALPREKPDNSFDNMETGLRWGATVKRWDISLMAAEVFEDNPVIEMSSGGRPLALYPRYQMAGGGFNFASDKFVWKGELAYKKNRRLNTIGLNPNAIETARHSVWDSAIGFDFDDNGAYRVSLELTNQHINAWNDDILQFRQDASVVYATWSKLFQHDTVTLQYTTSYHLQDKEHYHRFEYIHDLSNWITLELQADFFKSRRDNTLFDQLEGKHRLSAGIVLDF